MSIFERVMRWQAQRYSMVLAAESGLLKLDQTAISLPTVRPAFRLVITVLHRSTRMNGLGIASAMATRSVCCSDEYRDRTKHGEDEMSVSFMDRSLFSGRRFYNRTVGAHVLNWSHNTLSILGFSLMLKSTVDALHSPQARKNMKAGLSTDEYLVVCQALKFVSVLPEPDMPDGTFSDRRKAEYGILLLWNYVYVFST